MADSDELRIQDVRVRGRLDGPLSCRIEAGERVALLGRNGVGKSTLLRVAAGLLAPDSGTVVRPTAIGYVPQDFGASLLPWFRVDANVTLALRNDRARARSALDAVLAVVPLRTDRLRRYPYELSGGEQQLVALARGLATSPRILLLDEPFSALDLATRVVVRDAIARTCEARGMSAVLVTHDLADATAFATRAVVLASPPLRVAYDGILGPAMREDLERMLVGDAPGLRR